MKQFQTGFILQATIVQEEMRMKLKSKNLRYRAAVLAGMVLLLVWSSRALAADNGTNVQLYVPAQTTETGTTTDNNTDRTDQNEITGKVPEQKNDSDNGSKRETEAVKKNTDSRQTALVKTDDKTVQLLIWKMLLIIGGVIAGGWICLAGKKKFVKVRKNHEE